MVKRETECMKDNAIKFKNNIERVFFYFRLLLDINPVIKDGMGTDIDFEDALKKGIKDYNSILKKRFTFKRRIL